MDCQLDLAPASREDWFLVGLSGGADSVALTHMLLRQGLSVSACHVNHLLRGEESLRDQQFVEELCRQWRVPLCLLQEDVNAFSRREGVSVEEAGRQVRYGFFEQTAQRLQKESGKRVWIVTAHTLSDQVETVLFYLARGTGLRGLCGIPRVRGRILRPLLGKTREEVEDYCRQFGLSYVTDSTNLSPDYTRNRIRQQVIPALKQVNQNLEKNVGRMVAGLREDEAFLEQQAETAWEQAWTPEGLALLQLLAQPVPVRRRMVFRLLREAGISPSGLLSQEAEELLQRGKGRVSVGPGRYLEVRGERLAISDTKPPFDYWEIPFFTGIFESPSGKTYQIKSLETTTSERFHNLYKNLFAISLDCGKICGSITIRQKRDGDRIKLSGGRPTKSLKKLFQEAKIPVSQRSRLFVLADEQGVIAVEGFGAASRVCCDMHTDKMIVIEERGI